LYRGTKARTVCRSS